MIQIDVEMPKNCSVCLMRHTCKVSDEWDEFDYYYDGRLEGCPLKEVSDNSVLKDIKAEIKVEYDREAQNHDSFDEYSEGRYDAFGFCLRSIDKHIESKV